LPTHDEQVEQDDGGETADRGEPQPQGHGHGNTSKGDRATETPVVSPIGLVPIDGTGYPAAQAFHRADDATVNGILPIGAILLSQIGPPIMSTVAGDTSHFSAVDPRGIRREQSSFR
jgi:hypothetical protein